MKTQLAILRHRLSGNRLILSPKERTELLRIGMELDHDVKDTLIARIRASATKH